MNPLIDLKETEKKVFRASFADGLLDILLGYFVIVFAMTPLLTDLGLGDFWSSVVWLPLHGLMIGLFRLIKKQVVIPRLGSVEYGKPRKTKISQLHLFLSVVLALGIIIGLLIFKIDQPVRWLFPVIMIWLILFVSVVGSYLLDLRRLFYYGLLNASAALIGEVLFYKKAVSHHGIPLMFGLSGTIMIVTGTVYFGHFLGKYPRLSSGENNDKTEN